MNALRARRYIRIPNPIKNPKDKNRSLVPIEYWVPKAKKSGPRLKYRIPVIKYERGLILLIA